MGLLLAAPLARAQQTGQLRRVGMLLARPATDPEAQALAMAFRKVLQDLG